MRKYVFFFTVVLAVMTVYSVALADNGTRTVYLPAVQNGQPRSKQPTPPPSSTATPAATNTPTATPTDTPTATKTPTVTPTPTTTATPTNTPTSTPTETSPGQDIVIGPNHTSTVAGDMVAVYGELTNLTLNPVQLIEVGVQVKDSGGNVVATGSGSTWLKVLYPGDKTCFLAFANSVPASAQAYSVGVANYAVGGTSITEPYLALQNVTNNYDTLLNRWEASGKVRNDTNVEAKWVQVVGTLYSPTGFVIDCARDYVQLYDIAPGFSSSFEVAFRSTSSAVAGSYDLQAEGELP